MLIETLLNQLLPDMPGCPDITAINALRNSAIELCKETFCWNVIQDPFQLADLQSAYDIDVPTDAAVVRLMEVTMAVGPLLPKTMVEIGLLLPGWQSAQSSRPIYYNCAPAPTTIRVFPTPMNALRQTVTLRVAYQPTLSAETLPDTVVNDQFETLLDGARARLFAMPGRAWSNLPLVDFYNTRFAAKKCDLRISQIHENVVGSLSVQSRPFGY